MEKLLTMSGKEISRLEVIQRLEGKRLKQREAAKMLRISVRQVRRLCRAYREKGDISNLSIWGHFYFGLTAL